MKLVLDLETTYKLINKRTNPSPYLPSNKIVLFQYAIEGDLEGPKYIVVDHKEYVDPDSKIKIQTILDSATLIIGHNLKFDIAWLRECGFKINCPLYDTMIADYISSHGMKFDLSLKGCSLRHGINPKTDLMAEYIAKEVPVDEIPLKELIEYGLNDITTTWELYCSQQCAINVYSAPVLKFMSEFLEVLIDIERAGVAIDTETLKQLRIDYLNEQAELKKKLNETIIRVMGDTEVNLDSPEQLAQVIYSRKCINKDEWKVIFNIGTIIRNSVSKKRYPPRLSPNAFRELVHNNTVKIYKTLVEHCTICNGKGNFRKTKKDGTDYKKDTICKECKGTGCLYKNTEKVAGFKVAPADVQYVADGGFSASKRTLNLLLESGNLKDDVKQFIKDYLRYNAISTYITSFIDGIGNNIFHSNILHTNFNQCITATGRLSSSNPNFQNLPRDKTFPIRKVIISRWKGGSILDCDLAQIEFRVAAILSGCNAAKEDIRNGVDIHIFSRDTITNAGQPIDRQDAKIRCFPLNTLILTPDRGFVDYKNIKIGDKVINYCHIKKQLVVDTVIDYAAPHKQEIIKLYTKHNWSTYSTAEHRWYCDKVIYKDTRKSLEPRVCFTKNLNSSYRIITSAKYLNETDAYSNALTVDKAALLGWIFGDGSFDISPLTGITAQGKEGKRQHYAIQIIQKKHYKNNIRELLNKCNYNYREHTDKNHITRFFLSADSSRDLFRTVDIYSKSIDYTKLVLNMDANCRSAFLQAIKEAEGTQRKNGEWRIAQNSGNFCEAIKLCGFLCGHDIRTTKVIMKYNGKQHEQVTLRTRNYLGGTRLKKQSCGIQDVYCISTNNATCVIKQGDTITISGNTFKPLFRGLMGTPAEMVYYKAFLEEKYKGINEWHYRLAEEAISTKEIKSPSGRIYGFPEAKRAKNGLSSQMTQIANYEIQGFAGDIAQCCMIELNKEIKERDLKSKLILTVHDSVTADVFPGEESVMIQVFKKVFDNIPEMLYTRFGIRIDIPIGYDLKIGNNWSNTEKVAA